MATMIPVYGGGGSSAPNGVVTHAAPADAAASGGNAVTDSQKSTRYCMSSVTVCANTAKVPLTTYLQGSNDGSSWTNVVTLSGTTISTKTIVLTSSGELSTKYTYYRIYLSGVTSGQYFGLGAAAFLY